MIVAMLVCIPAMAQETSKEVENYRLKIELNENGKVISIDTVISGKEEFDAYVESLDLPDIQPGAEDIDIDIKDGDHQVHVVRRFEMDTDGLDSVIFMEMEGDSLMWHTDGDMKVKVVRKVEETEEIRDGHKVIIRTEIVERFELTELSEAEMATAGIESNAVEESIGLEVFPNPASDQLTLTVSGLHSEAATVYIRDMQGKIIFTYKLVKGLDSQTIHLGELEAGMYILEVVSQKSSCSKKLIIEQ